MSTWTHERARIASLTRSRTPDDPELLDARRNLRAARLEEYIKRVVDEAPELTAEQRDRLASLLRPATMPTASSTEAADGDAA
ncbi:hypothetical protein JCM18899A_18570 [Nocardioides sp. AN3]